MITIPGIPLSNFTLICGVILATLARILILKLENTTKQKVRFLLCLALFGLYTAAVLLSFNISCANILNDKTVLTGEQCFYRLCFTFLCVNVAILFVAFLFYATRKRRRLSDEEKLKLKDL